MKLLQTIFRKFGFILMSKDDFKRVMTPMVNGVYRDPINGRVTVDTDKLPQGTSKVFIDPDFVAVCLDEE